MRNEIHNKIRACAGIFMLVFFVANTFALEVNVTDKKGERIKDAVVIVTSVNGTPLTASDQDHLVIDQRDKEFIPYMTALSEGGSVIFPNNDNIRHQVYSFSEAKAFEIPLYEGNPDRPVVFDNAGVIAIGCNIHDWMKAYVYVAVSPYYALTDEGGMARLDKLPEGELEIQVWHPRLKGAIDDTTQTISSNTTASLNVAIDTKKVWRAFRSPSNAGSASYR